MISLLFNRWAILALALAVSHGVAWLHGWDTRGDREADRVQAAQTAERAAQSRVIGLAEAQARDAAEREELQRRLDDAATADPDAGRICLGADSVRRLGAP